MTECVFSDNTMINLRCELKKRKYENDYCNHICPIKKGDDLEWLKND
ncbi:hypothetical protein [Methanobrevibacter sp.]